VLGSGAVRLGLLLLVTAHCTRSNRVGRAGEAVAECAFVGGGDRLSAASISVEEAEHVPAQHRVDDGQLVHEEPIVVGGVVRTRNAAARDSIIGHGDRPIFLALIEGAAR
jgi:hypothetical protein